ncbi:MAG: CRISPR-associated endonuclease Cas1 [Candidatus Saccharibacteria bacterium]|nr:CRISPR-associated endonuclease Cas1 [Candidatus Saccharibacteria bacterium]
MQTRNLAKKQFLWLPYTSSIRFKGQTVIFEYNSNVEVIKFSDIHSIMFYGSVVNLSQEFLEHCIQYNIPIVIHRRNMTKAVFINQSIQTNIKDLLTKQILTRENEIKKNYIARQLIKAKLKSSNWLIKTDSGILKKHHNLNQIRSIEAISAKHYWEVYFDKLGYPNWTRRGENPVRHILDATSKFIAGILLRWISYHNLSPYHGYMHVQTEYPALIYDLMDPYRGYFEKAIFNSIKKAKALNRPASEWLPISINDLKTCLNSTVYTDATRQIVTMSELMHGIVLALRSYLLNQSYRFIVPIPGKPNGGRPIKAGYTLYGRRAGRTDFWQKVEEINKESLVLHQ